MNNLRLALPRCVCSWLLLGAALSPTPSLGATKERIPDAQARYQRDAAQCQSPRYAGDRDECMNAAHARLADAQPARAEADPQRYMRNALKRCEPLREPDRSDCLARMQGQGTTRGSVASGGIYRELVTREPAPAPASLPAPVSAPTPAPAPAASAATGG